MMFKVLLQTLSKVADESSTCRRQGFGSWVEYASGLLRFNKEDVGF